MVRRGARRRHRRRALKYLGARRRSAPVVWVLVDADRHRQPALLAELDRRARAGTRTHAGARQRDRLGVDVRACGSTSSRCCSARSPASPLAVWLDAAARARAARRARAAARRVRARGRGRGVGDRPLPARRGDRCCCCSARSRSAAGRCSSRARCCAACGWRGAALLVLYGVASAATTLSLTSLRNTLAYHEDFHKGLAVALPTPAVEARAAPLPAAVAAEQQADPRRALDPRHASASTTSSRAARRAPTSARARTRSRTASSAAASPSTRSAAPCSSRRSSTSATTRATRSRWTASGASSRAATTRSMATAERVPAAPVARWRGAGRGRRSRWCSPAGSGCACGASQQGLPYAYNADEADHFVPRAVAMFGHDLNPHYFANPPALHLPAALPVRGRLRRRARRAPRLRARTRASVYTLARVAAAVLGAARAVAALRDRRAAVRPRASGCSRRRSRRSRSCPSSTRTWRSTTCRRSRR